MTRRAQKPTTSPHFELAELMKVWKRCRFCGSNPGQVHGQYCQVSAVINAFGAWEESQRTLIESLRATIRRQSDQICNLTRQCQEFAADFRREQLVRLLAESEDRAGTIEAHQQYLSEKGSGKPQR